MRRWLIVPALLLIAPFGFAQGTAGSVELTPLAGYWFGDTLARGTTGAFDFNVTIDDAPAFGLRLGYRFASNWAIEALVARSNADLVTGAGELFGSRGEKIGEVDVTIAELGVEASLGARRLVPFIAGGFGATHLDPDLGNMGSDTRFTGHFGGGFKLFFSERIALRFDGRWHAVDVGNRSRDCDWWDDCVDNDDWLVFKEVALGLTFVF